jgi:hypothetical protein
MNKQLSLLLIFMLVLCSFCFAGSFLYNNHNLPQISREPFFTSSSVGGVCNCSSGVDGLNGSNGVNGLNGSDGINGTDGVDINESNFWNKTLSYNITQIDFLFLSLPNLSLDNIVTNLGNWTLYKTGVLAMNQTSFVNNLTKTDCASGSFMDGVLANGTPDCVVASSGSSATNVTNYSVCSSTPYTWTKPATGQFVKFQLWAGGGSGGRGGLADAGGGGGGGGYTERTMIFADVPSLMNCTVGCGGPAGITNDSTGVAGNATNLTSGGVSYAQVFGGGGGYGATTADGGGGGGGGQWGPGLVGAATAGGLGGIGCTGAGAGAAVNTYGFECGGGGGTLTGGSASWGGGGGGYGQDTGTAYGGGNSIWGGGGGQGGDGAGAPEGTFGVSQNGGNGGAGATGTGNAGDGVCPAGGGGGSVTGLSGKGGCGKCIITVW